MPGWCASLPAFLRAQHLRAVRVPPRWARTLVVEDTSDL